MSDPTDTSPANSLPTLSVVIPAYNSEGWVGDCIGRVGRAAEVASVHLAEVIVVDDGSTDDTVAEVERAVLPGERHPVIISQANRGRLAARTVGLERASGDMVLFIDTRVHLDESSLKFVFAQLHDPARRVWTAHTVANTGLSPIAGFWQAIEHVAWRRYWRRPRQITFGAEEFDFYPKGTTALLAPREILAEALAEYEPTVADPKISNDDTAVLRWVAEHHGITIAPGYSCVYNSRTTLGAFLKHANHRGAVLIDGYLRPGARFSTAILAVLVVSPVAALGAARHPKAVLPTAALASVAAGAGARAAGARAYDSAVLGVLATPFGVLYLAGMWRGVVARLRAICSGRGR